MDGLLIDSEPTYRNAWRQAGRSLGYPLSEAFVRSFIGKSYDLIEKILKSELGDDFPLDRFKATSSRFWHQSVKQTGIETKPGVRALLCTLEKYSIPYCLATNSEHAFAIKCLKYAGLTDAFPVRITRDQVSAPKPAPDIFLAAAAKLRTRPERCIVLEDSETGARAAMDANTVVILVPDPNEPAHPLLDQVYAVVDSLNEVRQLIETRYRDVSLTR